MTEDALAYVDKQRGLGALADKMGIEIVEFSIERSVARMPVEGNTQPVGPPARRRLRRARRVARVDVGEPPRRPGPPRRRDRDQRHAHARGDERLRDRRLHALHLGRTLTTHEIAVTDDQGRRCSTIRITNLIRDL